MCDGLEFTIHKKNQKNKQIFYSKVTAAVLMFDEDNLVYAIRSSIVCTLLLDKSFISWQPFNRINQKQCDKRKIKTKKKKLFILFFDSIFFVCVSYLHSFINHVIRQYTRLSVFCFSRCSISFSLLIFTFIEHKTHDGVDARLRTLIQKHSLYTHIFGCCCCCCRFVAQINYECKVPQPVDIFVDSLFFSRSRSMCAQLFLIAHSHTYTHRFTLYLVYDVVVAAVALRTFASINHNGACKCTFQMFLLQSGKRRRRRKKMKNFHF